MTEKIKILLADPRVRRYLYRVLMALAAILVARGVLSATDVSLLETLAEAILGVGAGVAHANANDEWANTLTPRISGSRRFSGRRLPGSTGRTASGTRFLGFTRPIPTARSCMFRRLWAGTARTVR